MRLAAITIFICCFFSAVQAQRQFEEEISLKGAEKVNITVKWVDVVEVKEYQGQAIKIEAKVMINNGENDDAFELKSELVDGELKISSVINQYVQLPKRIQMMRGEEKIFFSTNNMEAPEVLEAKKKGYQSIQYGVIVDIKLVAYIPQGQKLTVDAKYGTIETSSINKSWDLYAKYGSIDVSCSNEELKSIRARVKYGEIFTNHSLDLKGNDPKNAGDWLEIYASESAGNSMSSLLESKYGNIYIRQK